MIRVGGLVAGLVLVTTPALAQQCETRLVATGGGQYAVTVAGAVVSNHSTERAAAARAISLYRQDSTKAVGYQQDYRVRVEGCAGGFRVDTLPGRVDTAYVRDSVPPIVTPPPPPPPPADTTPVPPPPPPPPPPVDTTPTPPSVGRQFVSAERLATWRGMRDANHYLWRTAISTCDQTGTSTERYGDIGMWCAIIAATNDDAAAAAKAIAKLKQASPTAVPNTIREEFIARVLMLDLVAPWLTSADRAAVSPIYDQWASHTPGFRTGDSDAYVGEGIGAMLWDLFNNRTPNRGNVITELSRYPAIAAGGQWFESSQYNAGTLTLLAMGNAAYRTATGSDVVPGVSALLRDAGFVQALEVTPDFRQSIQWADDQYPRDFAGRLYRRLAFLGGTTSPEARWVADELYRRNPTVSAAQLMAYGLYLWRADVTPQPVDTVTHIAFGLGHLFTRTGSTLMWATAQTKVGADHSDFAAAFDVQVYRNGWLLTHPIAYYGLMSGELITNGAVYAGLGYFNTRTTTWADSGNGWAAIAGQVSGSYFAVTGFPPPPPFLDVGHRVTVLATVNGEPVVIVRDSVAMQDPRTVGPGIAGYRQNATYQHQARITEFDGAPWAIWHAPVQPTVTGNRATWQAATGDAVSLWWDGGTVVTTVNEAQVFGTDVTAAEKKWQLRIRHGGVLWQVWSTGTPNVSRSGDQITVNGRTFRVTSAGVEGP